jgi:hypothetical protein
MSVDSMNAASASNNYLNIEPPKSLTEQVWVKSDKGQRVGFIALAIILLPLSAIFVGVDFLVKHFRVLSFNKKNKDLISEVQNCQGMFRSYIARKKEAAAVEIQRVYRGKLSRTPLLERQMARVVAEVRRQTALDPTACVVITDGIRGDVDALNAALVKTGVFSHSSPDVSAPRNTDAATHNSIDVPVPDNSVRSTKNNAGVFTLTIGSDGRVGIQTSEKKSSHPSVDIQYELEKLAFGKDGVSSQVDADDVSSGGFQSVPTSDNEEE